MLDFRACGHTEGAQIFESDFSASEERPDAASPEGRKEGATWDDGKSAGKLCASSISTRPKEVNI